MGQLEFIFPIDHLTDNNNYRISDTEIDILCINPDATKYLVGECKFKSSPFSYSDYLNTVAKLLPLKEKYEFHYALFSENGFDDKIADSNEDIMLFSLKDIVNCKI